MADIRTVVDRENQMTTNTVEGRLNIDEVLATVRHYLSSEPTPKVLWDVRRADGSGLASKDLIRLQDAVARMAPAEVRRKVAIVVSRDLGFGLSRMAESQGELAGVSADYFVTRSIADALAWLDVVPG